MRKIFINTGAVLLIISISIFLVKPGLHGTRDPSREQIQDMQAYKRDMRKEAFRRELPLLFLSGICCATGIACFVIGLKYPNESK